VCAEALHQHGPRKTAPFIAINCGAIPRELIEAELFGAARGAYTGAIEDRRGAAEEADGGTLFLDEIGELDISLQTKLLRFLQTGTITRIGESRVRPVNVRVICATNRDPMALIAARQFREDLFYRLHVLPIHLPPIRQRPADILPLARHFLERYAQEERKPEFHLSEQTADLFVQRDWPGNVRQLQNLIRRIVVMFDGGEVDASMVAVADIEARVPVSRVVPDAADSSPKVLPMWRQEQAIIERALDVFDGNIARAAAALEISPSTIYRKRQSWAEMEAGLGAA
jgi:two-component system repressor protein LuxO